MADTDEAAGGNRSRRIAIDITIDGMTIWRVIGAILMVWAAAGPRDNQN